MEKNIPEVLRMRPYHVESVRYETPSVFTLTLLPEDGEPSLTFRSGQWVYLHLLHEDGTSWGKAAFSLANAYTEGSSTLEFGIKIAGGLTQRAARLQQGDRVCLQGPFGVFTLPDVLPESLAFFAGGIGISPLRSMIQDLSRRAEMPATQLFCSNRVTDGIPYEKEFRQLETDYPNFSVVFSLTGGCPDGWKGERGRFDADMIGRYRSTFATTTSFLCGPKPFMDAIRASLVAAGAEPKKGIREERFD